MVTEERFFVLTTLQEIQSCVVFEWLLEFILCSVELMTCFHGEGPGILLSLLHDMTCFVVLYFNDSLCSLLLLAISVRSHLQIINKMR